MNSIPHSCNAYCREGHCEALYFPEGTSEGRIAQLLGWNFGLRLIRAERAKEAHPWQMAREILTYGPEPATEPWLVWFTE